MDKDKIESTTAGEDLLVCEFYSSRILAEVARARLEAEDIRAVICERSSIGAEWGGGLMSHCAIYVPAKLLERARAVTSDVERDLSDHTRSRKKGKRRLYIPRSAKADRKIKDASWVWLVALILLVAIVKTSSRLPHSSVYRRYDPPDSWEAFWGIMELLAGLPAGWASFIIGCAVFIPLAIAREIVSWLKGRSAPSRGKRQRKRRPRRQGSVGNRRSYRIHKRADR